MRKPPQCHRKKQGRKIKTSINVQTLTKGFKFCQSAGTQNKQTEKHSDVGVQRAWMTVCSWPCLSCPNTLFGWDGSQMWNGLNSHVPSCKNTLLNHVNMQVLRMVCNFFDSAPRWISFDCEGVGKSNAREITPLTRLNWNVRNTLILHEAPDY